jgi:hypothetical protein
MIRRAIIVYCDKSPSGDLKGPYQDNIKYREFLQSSLGGHWFDTEISSLRNPTGIEVRRAIQTLFYGADYTFLIFSGHGCIERDSGTQYLEVADGDLSVLELRTNAIRQTLIIDACRGYFSFPVATTKSFSESISGFTGNMSTRDLFNKAVLAAESGWSILYSADVDQSASDSDDGGVYLFSLLTIAKLWKDDDREYTVLPLNFAHEIAKNYIPRHYKTIQNPVMEQERRKVYFPFAVKFIPIYS